MRWSGGITPRRSSRPGGGGGRGKYGTRSRARGGRRRWSSTRSTWWWSCEAVFVRLLPLVPGFNGTVIACQHARCSVGRLCGGPAPAGSLLVFFLEVVVLFAPGAEEFGGSLGGFDEGGMAEVRGAAVDVRDYIAKASGDAGLGGEREDREGVGGGGGEVGLHGDGEVGMMSGRKGVG